MIKPLIILSVCLPGVALADDVWINVHLGSVHNESTVTDDDGKEYEINNFNPGIGIEIPTDDRGYRNENNSYRFGLFKNSYSDLSLYAGIDAHTKYTNGFGVGATFGIVSGYQNSPSGRNVMPGVVPRIMYIYNGYRAEMAFVYGKDASALAFTVGMSY